MPADPRSRSAVRFTLPDWHASLAGDHKPLRNAGNQGANGPCHYPLRFGDLIVMFTPYSTENLRAARKMYGVRLYAFSGTAPRKSGPCGAVVVNKLSPMLFGDSPWLLRIPWAWLTRTC